MPAVPLLDHFRLGRTSVCLRVKALLAGLQYRALSDYGGL